jgi:hypothetical protein
VCRLVLTINVTTVFVFFYPFPTPALYRDGFGGDSNQEYLTHKSVGRLFSRSYVRTESPFCLSSSERAQAANSRNHPYVILLSKSRRDCTPALCVSRHVSHAVISLSALCRESYLPNSHTLLAFTYSQFPRKRQAYSFTHAYAKKGYHSISFAT